MQLEPLLADAVLRRVLSQSLHGPRPLLAQFRLWCSKELESLICQCIKHIYLLEKLSNREGEGEQGWGIEFLPASAGLLPSWLPPKGDGSDRSRKFRTPFWSSQCVSGTLGPFATPSSGAIAGSSSEVEDQ